MKSSETELEPRLAWAIWQGLQKLSDLLWDRYEEDFLDRTDEVGDWIVREGGDLTKDSEEDLEVPF
jgi:hypothetical protein